MRRAMRYFGVRRVGVRAMPTGDIRVWLGGGTPLIEVGPNWRRCHAIERRKRLVHEALHVAGYLHSTPMRRRHYYSKPQRDQLSRRVYEDIARGRRTFEPWRFGLPRAVKRYG